MTSLAEELIEAVARSLAAVALDVEGYAPGTDERADREEAAARDWPLYVPEARAAAAAVLGYFSDYVNVSKNMAERSFTALFDARADYDPTISDLRDESKKVAAAMMAARSELG